MRNSNKNFDFSRVKAVLFDFDGTLMDSEAAIVDSWRHTVRELEGREIGDGEIMTTHGEMLFDSMQRLIKKVDPEYALDFYREYQRSIFLDRIKLYDGAADVLKQLNAAGLMTGLVTSRLRRSTERALAHFGIEELFDAILTASDTDKFKPDPAPIYMALDLLNPPIRPCEAIFIGDTTQDIEAGKAAGVYTILVGWSYALPPGKMREEAPAPDATITGLQDILSLLGL